MYVLYTASHLTSYCEHFSRSIKFLTLIATEDLVIKQIPVVLPHEQNLTLVGEDDHVCS